MLKIDKPSRFLTKAMELYAHWITKMWALKFIFNDEGESYTDCSTFISIGWNADWLNKNVKNKEQWFAAIKGLIEHECAHIKYSSIKGEDEYYRKCRILGVPYMFARYVRNIIEDGRVNRCHVNDDPKALSCIRWVCELHYRYAASLPLSGDLIIDVLNSLIQRARCGKDLPNLAGEVISILDDIQPYLEKGIMAETSQEMLEVSALPICEKLLPYVPDAEISLIQNFCNDGRESDCQNGLGEKAPQGNLDPRKPIEIKVKKKDQQEETDSCCDENENEEKPAENSPSDGEEKKKIPNSISVDEEPSDDELSDDSNESIDEEGDSEQDDENPDDSAVDISNMGQDFEDCPTGPSPLPNVIVELDDDEFEELFDACEGELKQIEKQEQEDQEKAQAEANALLQSIQTKPDIPQEIHSNVEFREIVAEPNETIYEELYSSINDLIDEWIELIEARIERNRIALLNKCSSGYLDPKVAYQAVAFHNNRVFRQKQLSKEGDMAVYNLIDCSGSMSPSYKWENAVKAAICLSNTLERLNVSHTVVTYCEDALNGCLEHPRVTHMRLIGWGQKDKVGLGGFECRGLNRDGYSIRVAVEELKSRPEKIKVLIVECDGLPNSKNYDSMWLDSNGIQDTADAVQEARMQGIKVICLYYGDTDKLSLAKAKCMYGDGLVVVRDVRELVYDLVEVMDEELKRIF